MRDLPDARDDGIDLHRVHVARAQPQQRRDVVAGAGADHERGVDFSDDSIGPLVRHAGRSPEVRTIRAIEVDDLLMKRAVDIEVDIAGRAGRLHEDAVVR